MGKPKTIPASYTPFRPGHTLASRFLRDLWSGLLDLVYPPKCLVCGEMQPDYLCDECVKDIVRIDPPVCYRCGAPLQEGRCRDCQGVEFAFDSARAIGVYDGALREAIHKFKYSGHRVLGPILGGLLVEFLRSQVNFVRGIDCIVPMPIHPSRLKVRGFNQSDLLASEVARAIAVPVLPRVLTRTKPTRPQVDLPVEKRRENVEGAFEVIRADAVSGRAVLLVDDVLTTGSTADAGAAALRDAGAREVRVLTLARSV